MPHENVFKYPEICYFKPQIINGHKGNDLNCHELIRARFQSDECFSLSVAQTIHNNLENGKDSLDQSITPWEECHSAFKGSAALWCHQKCWRQVLCYRSFKQWVPWTKMIPKMDIISYTVFFQKWSTIRILPSRKMKVNILALGNRIGYTSENRMWFHNFTENISTVFFFHLWAVKI